MRHRLYYHIVWTTLERAPSIDAEVAALLCRVMPGVVRAERGRLLETGIVTTHVHLLATLHPQSNIPRLLQRLKGGSAFLANRTPATVSVAPLRWADGYTIETVSPRQLDHVRHYIRTQPEHHPDQAIRGWNSSSGRQEYFR